MKKTLIITLVILVFVLLGVRVILTHSRKLLAEREWYINNLNVAFSAEIDSVMVNHLGHGLLYFHVTSGKFDPAHEDLLRTKLDHHAMLFLIDEMPSGAMEMATEEAIDFLKGDSITIVSQKNEIVNFRCGRMLKRYALLTSLRGNEF